jgi:ribonuclease HII
MPHFKLELKHAPARVCGVDEAGRGPWAGPVVAAALIFQPGDTRPRGLDDSKKLDRAAREEIFDKLIARNIIHAVGIASVEEIDEHNIWGATQLAMCRAVAALSLVPDVALIDGNLKPKDMPCIAHPVVNGDAISFSIAAASIIAKVTRDRIMAEHARIYPHYGFERHAGYGTPCHQEALATHGPCILHRRSFAPIRLLLENAA